MAIQYDRYLLHDPQFLITEEIQTINTVVTTFPDGTNILPGMTFTADITTGIYRYAPGALGFTTASSEKMVIDIYGNFFVNIAGNPLPWPTTGNYRGFQLGVYGGLAMNMGGSAQYYMSNLSFDGTNFHYSSTNGAALLSMVLGGYSIFTMPSGTGGTVPDTTNTNRFYVSKEGNIHLQWGTVALPWPTAGNYRGIQLGYAGGILTSTVASDYSWAQNAYYNGTSWIYSTDGAVSWVTLAGGNVHIQTNPGGLTGLAVNQIVRFTADSTGNFGFNYTTMKAWPTASTGWKGIQIGQNGGIQFDNPGTTIGFQSNVYFDGTNYRYSIAASTPVSLFQLTSGQVSFYTGAAGTIGNIVTLTEIVRFDVVGNAGFNFGTMLSWPTSGSYRGLQVGRYGGFYAQSAGPDIYWLSNLYHTGSGFFYSSGAAAAYASLNGGAFDVFTVTGTGAATGNPATQVHRFGVNNYGNLIAGHSAVSAYHPTTGTRRNFQLGNTGGLSFNSATTDVSFQENMFWNGSGWVYGSNSYVGCFSLSSGAFTIFTAPNGFAAGASVTLTQRFVVANAGSVYIGTTGANTFMSTGLSIHQGAATDEILAFKATAVTHGITSIADTDTYAEFKMAATTEGGLMIRAYSEGNYSLFQLGIVTTGSTLKTTSAFAPLIFDGGKKSGTTYAGMAANENLMLIRDVAGGTKFIFDADGDSHQDLGRTLRAAGGAADDVGVGWTNFDAHDDIQLLNALAITLAPESDPLRQQFYEYIEENRFRIESLPGKKLVTYNEDGHHFVNMTRLAMLQTGAIRQVGSSVAQLFDEVADLREQVAGMQRLLESKHG